MFRNVSVPQRKVFSLSRQQIIDDIEAVKNIEEEKNKLFFCLDEKPPQEHKFIKIEEFLKGTNDLEDMSETLADLTYEVGSLKKEIIEKIDELKKESHNILKSES